MSSSGSRASIRCRIETRGAEESWDDDLNRREISRLVR